jgi:hypothetical protein
VSAAEIAPALGDARRENNDSPSIAVYLPPARRAPNRVARRNARHLAGPSWSCAKAAMTLVGRAVALAPDDQQRREALREDARALAVLVREREIPKPDAVDRILNAGVAFGIHDADIAEILHSEFSE